MSKVNRYKNRYHKGENMSEAFEENIEQAAAQEQTVNFDQGWFVIQTYSGYENKVKENLLERAQTYNMTDNILRIEIPTETVDKEVNGKRKEVEENLFPGYVLVEMNMTDEAWFVVGRKSTLELQSPKDLV